MFNSLSRFVGVITLAFAAGLGAQQSNSASPRELLKQYVAELKKNVAGQLDCQRVSTALSTACETLGKIDRDNEDALREKIIKLAVSLEPPPAVPEEARRHFVKADTLAHDVRAPQDIPPAIDEYQQALAAAPWWGDVYRDLAIELETAGRYDEAKKDLRFYLLGNPGDKEARAAQDKIYKIEAKQQKATKRAAEDAAKAQEIVAADAEREKEKRLEGRYVAYVHREGSTRGHRWWSERQITLEIRDGRVVEGSMIRASDSDQNFPYHQNWTVPLNGRKFHYEDKYTNLDGIISADGSTITETYLPTIEGPGFTLVYHRQ